MLLIDNEVYVDRCDNLIVVKQTQHDEFYVYADWAYYHPNGRLKDNNEDNKYGDIVRLATRDEIRVNRVLPSKSTIELLEAIAFSLSVLIKEKREER